MYNKNWISAHLYYSDNLHKFLVEAVKPFKEFVLTEGLAENYFFIRYWEKGSHIRLRFNGNSETLNTVLKPKLIEYFNDYFLKYPSIRTEDKSLEKEYVTKELFYPNNSVQFIDYEPEFERYGGIKGLLISEKLFEMSSDASLEILFNTDVNDYENTGQRAIGAAIQLHLAALKAFKYTRNDISLLFEDIFNEWIPSAYRVFTKNENLSFSPEDRSLYKDHMIDVFNKQANQIEPVLKPFMNDFFEALESEFLFEEKWINKWNIDMYTIYAELKNSINSHKILIPEWYPNKTTDRTKNILNYLQGSYIHMTNNRVGVLNHNESFIAFLIKELLKLS